jgi:hypothetical protein
MKIPERHRIGLFGRFVLLDGDFVDVADRRDGRVGFGLENHFQIIVEVGRRLVVQLSFGLVLLFDDLDRFAAMSFEKSDAFADAAEHFVDDVGVFLDEGQTTRYGGEPHHRQERNLDDFETDALGKNIRGRRDKRRVRLAVAHRFPVKLAGFGLFQLAVAE